MAILFRILFTLGLLILYASALSAQPQVNKNGPETPLKFISENPSYVLASSYKNSPIYLNCHVSVKIDINLQNHLKTTKFYHDPNEDVDDNDDRDEPETKANQEEIRRLYQEQYEKNLKNKTNTVSDAISTQPESKKSRRRATRSVRERLSYEWLKDEETVISSKADDNQLIFMDGVTLFPNGTLKFQATNSMTGEWRCKAKYFDKGNKIVIGPILSTATVVEIANLINDMNEKKNLTIFEGESIVVNCPITSVPEGNYSWYFNNDNVTMGFDAGLKKKDARYFVLSNGSLLIINSQLSDSGKFRCNVTNQFTKKLFRSWFSMLNVMSRSEHYVNHRSLLLPQLQSSDQKIKSGQSLVLHCASQGREKISWTFTPRSSNIPISLTDFNNELRYVNVSVTKHDGIYNCSTESDFQIFDVTVITPPVFIQPLKPMETSVSAAIKFNCSVTGNPPPKVDWYKNGEKVPNNHVKYFEYPIIKIESIDPEDEGIYQCLARNDFGEVSNTFYLHVRPTFILNNGPQNAKCYPMDKNVVFVTFDEENPLNRIQYFIASDSPRGFYSQISMETNVKNLQIDTNKASIFKPLKPFYLYMRNMMPSGDLMTQKMAISKLSKPIICATQGIEPRFVKPLNGGIFIRWEKPSSDLNITSYTVQFLNNKTSNPVVFVSEVIGTYEDWPTYVSWSDIDKSLQKVPARSLNKSDWTEVQVPGNVTGLYIINTEEVNVRILGTVLETGELLNQDLKYLSWTNIKASSLSMEPLKVREIDSRAVEIHWSGLDSVTCAYMCTTLKQEFISRDAENKFKCEEIHSLSAKTFYLRNLRPTSDYDVFIQDCNSNVISTVINFQTKRDVPGPVTQSHIITDNGIVLHWKPPSNPNGEIYHYLLEWTYKNVTRQQNVNELSFKFPNTTSTDRFNITVKAFGVAGLGYPLIINPDKWGILPVSVIGSDKKTDTTIYFDSFMIFIIISISLVIVVLVIGYVLCRRNRYCKNNNGMINSEQSSFPPTTSPLSENNQSDEMYEMQTLIPTSQLVMANGKEPSIRSDNPPNGGISDNQKILRTSTPTDDSVDQMCIELPPIKCDDGLLAIQVDESKPKNGSFLKTFHSKPLLTTEKKDLTNDSLKVNGNISPIKCFQSPGPDQNSSSGSSSFDSHRQLIDTNICNGFNNNNVVDRSKIGKSSSIETDNEEEDSEENMHEYDLNDSNLSSKPLHPMSWDFRRPLVGPNG